MTENTAPSALNDSASASPGKNRTWPVVAAVVFVVAMLLYIERLPSVLFWPLRILFWPAAAWLVFKTIRAIRVAKFEAKKLLFSAILLLMLYGALYVVCLVFIKLMSARDKSLTTVDTTQLTERARRGINAMLSGDSPSLFDKDIGWVPRPGYEWKMHKIGPQGLRGTRVYPETPADPEKRILCIGDSFTFGYEVEDDQTFPYHGEQLLPDSEWINLGICGGGLTQSLLHYRKNGRKFGGKYVVIGFMTNNGKRTLNCFRAFLSPDDAMTPLTKPFAKLSNGVFSLEPNPYQDISEYPKLLANEAEELKKLYELDYYTWSEQHVATNPVFRTARFVWDYRYGDRNLSILLNRPIVDSSLKYRPGDDPYGRPLWHPKGRGFQTLTKVFDLYYEEVIADGRIPLIVVLPGAGDVERRAQGRQTTHATLLKHFDKKGYRYFDFLDTLETIHGENLGKADLFGKTHFNGATNKVIAEEIIKALPLSE